MTTSARHETRALLRAHLSAATGYRHLTRHCPICHQLLRLAMEPTAADNVESAASATSVPSAPPQDAPGSDLDTAREGQREEGPRVR
jgi:hypothetical protein